MKWEVGIPANAIFVGLELDFLENPEISGTPQPQLEVGDSIALQMINQGKWLNGTVTQASASQVIVDFGTERWLLGPRVSSDIFNPVITSMRLRIWYARQKL